MAKKMKKIDPKAVRKAEVMEVVTTSLTDAGFEVVKGEAFGFTAGTLVVRGGVCDVQIKPITPKAGVNVYEEVADEE